MDFAIAHFVVTKDVTLKDLELLLVNTLAHIVAISYDDLEIDEVIGEGSKCPGFSPC